MSYKVLVVIGDGFKDVEQMFVRQGWELTADIEDADLVQFVGGDDVDPSMYNQHTHESTFCNYNRDDKERAIYTMALDRGIPMAGICRGGQFLNVMNGGKMWQDVDGHNTGEHDAYLAGSKVPIKVTSTHHQMMFPNWGSGINVKMLLVAKVATEKVMMSSKDAGVYPIVTKANPAVEARTDIESLYYPHTRSLCFQPHPEYHGAIDTLCLYFRFLEQYCFGEEGLVEEVQA